MFENEFCFNYFNANRMDLFFTVDCASLCFIVFDKQAISCRIGWCYFFSSFSFSPRAFVDCSIERFILTFYNSFFLDFSMSCINYKIKDLYFPPDYTENSFLSVPISRSPSLSLSTLLLAHVIFLAFCSWASHSHLVDATISYWDGIVRVLFFFLLLMRLCLFVSYQRERERGH